MSYLLVAYSKTAFQEFILPRTDNVNYDVVLDHGVFACEKDITISLEIVNGIWRLVDIRGQSSLSPSSSLEPGQALAAGGILQLNQETNPVTVLVMEASDALSRMRKYRVKSPCRITIGQAADNQIRYSFHSLVSKHHARLEIGDRTCVVQDTSTNGIFMGNIRIHENTSLRFGDIINILGLQIVWLGDTLVIGSVDGSELVDSRYLVPLEPLLSEELKESGGEREEKKREEPEEAVFRRSPRNLPSFYEEPIEIEGPPQMARGQQRPLLLSIGPSLTMALPMVLGVLLMQRSGGTGAFMYMGITIAVSSAILGAMWAIINLQYSKKQNKLSEINRRERYRAYLEKQKQFIAQRYAENKAIMEECYPPVRDCAAYSRQTPELWNRNTRHSDFLFVRLGTGSVPFQAPISIPKERFRLYDDNLEQLPGEIKKQYAYIQDAPVGIDLMEKRLVGVVGGAEKAGAYSVVRCMAVQLAACSCYTDVKMAFIFRGNSKRSRDNWAYARWLPHVWSEDKRTRYIAADPIEQGEICFALSNIFREREESQKEFSSREKQYRPHYVIFLEDIRMLEGEPILRYLMEPEKNYGVSLVVMAERFEDLPNACENIIRNDGEFAGMYNSEDSRDDRQAVLFDEITPEEAERFTRCISGVEVNEPESGGEIPDSLSFLEMYGVKTIPELNVLDKWRKNRAYENMRVLIGQKSGGSGWYLDIHEKYHGPHGLLAGTTGSGKSETLQTYMLSLAVNYSPDDIAFFVIDFKGGGMANLFSNLPHMAGQISNLSGNQIRRAMVSIKSENRRRQQLFSEYSVNHVDQYMRLYKSKEATEPIPHLFIIIDEFAELKREEPEFMKELISVAQVGRSLGVHLILATQKPSGTVDNNIWSNAKFRICLRVQDRQDSNDMLHKPDAAFITRAGRGYMQVGNDELYEQFQSGWSGAEYDETLAESNTDIVHMKTNSGKSAIVGNYAKVRRKEVARLQWLEHLAEVAEEVARKQKLTWEDRYVAQPDSFLNGIYDRLWMDGIDFHPSRGNTAALKHYLSLIGSYEKKGEKVPLRQILKLTGGKGLPECKGKTQLSAIVDYLERMAQENGYHHQFQLWLPVLSGQLYLNQLADYEHQSVQNGTWPEMGREWKLEAMVGMYDNPSAQIQAPLTVNLSSDGHLAVCGAVVSGKSTFLQTLLYALFQRYSPEWVNVYAMDFSSKSLSAFEGYPHVGDVMYEDDGEKISKFFTMISGILKQRKQLFRGGNYRQYVQASGPEVPAILIVIDNYASFKEKTEGIYDNILISLSREGEGCGIFLVLTSGGFGSAEIPNRVADNIRNVLCLEMGDKFKYGDVLRTMRFDVLPEGNIKGRGLAVIGGSVLEFQTALALPAENDYARSAAIQQAGERMSALWNGRRARPVPVIPEKPTWSSLMALEQVKDSLAAGDSIPYGYNAETADIQTLELSRTFCWLISGKERTGKTNLLRILLLAGREIGAQMTVFDFGGGGLKNISEQTTAAYVTDAAETFRAFQSLVPVFRERNLYKRELLEKGLDEEDVYQAMKKYPPVFLLIDNYREFLNIAYQPPEGVGIIAGFLENIVEKGRLHNIYLFVTLNSDEVSKVNGRNAYLKLVAYRSGIHLGGNVIAQHIFDFSRMPFGEQGKTLRAGVGLLPPAEERDWVEKVVIPYGKG